ncbi:MAG: hypothetical protein L0206_19025 [Actinobacteria bacterium]|nr:hypothetical protein [Actinomycetota bacterium]
MRSIHVAILTAFWLVAAFASLPTSGQVVCEPIAIDVAGLEEQEGLHHFAVENRDARFVARRGRFSRALESLTLPPNTCHRIWVVQAAKIDKVGVVEFTTPENGRRFALPRIVLKHANPHDTDGDGLSDQAEFVLGTDPRSRDSDADGVSDLAEAQQGTDPLDGRPAGTGLIASVDTPGTAVDVCAINDVAIVADSDRGVSVFSVFNGMDPKVVARVDTPGDARRVACSGRRIAVADGDAGLAIIDISDPPAARVAFQLFPLALGGAAASVAAAGGIAYVGLGSGGLAVVDLQSGTILERLTVSSRPVLDLAIDRDSLLALDETFLHTIPLRQGRLRVLGTVQSPVVTIPNKRVFAGNGLAYAVHGQGANTFDVSDPSQPRLLAQGSTEQFGWEQVVLNGSGLALAVVGTGGGVESGRGLSVYDARDPLRTDVFITSFGTPGIARAVRACSPLSRLASPRAQPQHLPARWRCAPRR